MTTGKTDEPEPDYVRIETEFTRLERAVIDAVRQWRKEHLRVSHTTYTADQKRRLYDEADMLLAVKADALEEFEANQKNG